MPWRQQKKLVMREHGNSSSAPKTNSVVDKKKLLKALKEDLRDEV